MLEPVNVKPPGASAPGKRRIHWHVFFTHFPIAFFGGSAGFQILHLFMAPACFELATNVALVAGVISLLPTIWSGWREWKSRYQGAKGLIFRRKISLAVGLVTVALPLVTWRLLGFGFFEEAHTNPLHVFYFAGNMLLIAGAALEGYYGGRLTHR
jgi:hypothetical protein